MNDFAGSRYGITTDMWTSAAKRGYIVTTLHYINKNWEMKNVTVAFIYMVRMVI